MSIQTQHLFRFVAVETVRAEKVKTVECYGYTAVTAIYRLLILQDYELQNKIYGKNLVLRKNKITQRYSYVDCLVESTLNSSSCLEF